MRCILDFLLIVSSYEMSKRQRSNYILFEGRFKGNINSVNIDDSIIAQYLNICMLS